jgi:long-chain acyl-CoA synthetase
MGGIMQSSDVALDTMPKLLARNVAEFGDSPAYREKDLGIWQTWTWTEASSEVMNLAKGLIDLGIKEADHVAVIGRNRPYLYWSLLAIQHIGAVPVPLYQDAVAEEMEYILTHCNATFAIVGDQEQVDKIYEISGSLKGFKDIVYVDPKGLRKYDKTKLHDFDSIIKRGKNDTGQLASQLDGRIAKIDGDTTCVLCYTSGTTGKSKGVVQTHKSIIGASMAAVEFDQFNNRDSILSYLPMAWVGDFMISVGLGMAAGGCINCPEGPDTMQPDLREIGPSFFFGPPPLWERLKTSVYIRIEDASPIKKAAFHYFMDTAAKVGKDIMEKKPVGIWDRVKYSLGNIIIFGPLKNMLGMSKVRIAYTAGEAISSELFDFYRSLGINLKQLYGQTEASVFLTMQGNDEVYSDTVGKPLKGVELKIANSGEVLYRAPGTFKEYYKNPKATTETKDKDGWVATGDAGYMDDETGQLRIIDRAKDVGKLKSGALFAPKYVENKLKFFPNILEAVLFGDGKENCVAFLNIDLTAVGNWAERNNISYASYQELAANGEVGKILKEHVESVNMDLAKDPMMSGCQIKRFLVLHKELDPDDGEITRTRKVKRTFVAEKYSDLVSALYSGKTSIDTKTEVTYEDGRKGYLEATLGIVDATLYQLQKQSENAA